MNLEPVKYEEAAIYAVNQRIPNICRSAGAALQRSNSQESFIPPGIGNRENFKEDEAMKKHVVAYKILTGALAVAMVASVPGMSAINAKADDQVASLCTPPYRAMMKTSRNSVQISWKQIRTSP